MPKNLLIYMCGCRRLSRRPAAWWSCCRSGCLFGVVGRSSRYQVHCGNLFAGVGRLGSQFLIFGCGFYENLKDLSFLGYVGLSLLLVSTGWSLPSVSPGCGVVCGCSPGPAAPWQPLSRRRWSEKLCLVAGGLRAWIPCLRRQTVTLV